MAGQSAQAVSQEKVERLGVSDPGSAVLQHADVLQLHLFFRNRGINLKICFYSSLFYVCFSSRWPTAWFKAGADHSPFNEGFAQFTANLLDRGEAGFRPGVNDDAAVTVAAAAFIDD